MGRPFLPPSLHHISIAFSPRHSQLRAQHPALQEWPNTSQRASDYLKGVQRIRTSITLVTFKGTKTSLTWTDPAAPLHLALPPALMHGGKL